MIMGFDDNFNRPGFVSGLEPELPCDVRLEGRVGRGVPELGAVRRRNPVAALRQSTSGTLRSDFTSKAVTAFRYT